METKLYLQLSAIMFLEYAIWGTWAPVLAARLLGPLKMSGKQTGWIYATIPLACIISPLLAGQLADKWLNTEWILAVSHLAGAVLLYLAATQRQFKPLFIVMLLYSLFYAATMPLVNSVIFGKVEDSGFKAGQVFVWAPVGWALVGYFLTGWRWKFKTGDEGKDCLYLGAILSLVMVVACLILPSTPPAGTGGSPFLKAMGMLKEPSFLFFVVFSMMAIGTMQFYFLGTAQFMQDMRIPNKNVPASMAIAQVCQTVATYFTLDWLLDINRLGFKWTLVVGAACWMVMYAVYVATKPRWLIIISQSLHGLAYAFFVIGGQFFVGQVAKKEIASSSQALIFAATMGVGLFLGTQLASITMDRYRKEEQFQWRSIFLVPCGIMTVCVLAFILLFKG